MLRQVAFVVVLGAGALLGSAATKAAPPMRKHFNLPGKDPKLPFSDAVLVGDTLYLSGRLGLKPGTREVPATAEEEARNILDQFKQVLAAAGMTMDDLVSVQVFCSDVSLFDTWNSVRKIGWSGVIGRMGKSFFGRTRWISSTHCHHASSPQKSSTQMKPPLSRYWRSRFTSSSLNRAVPTSSISTNGHWNSSSSVSRTTS